MILHYNEYLNRYSDTSYYFLTWGTQNGNRIPEQKLALNVTDTLDYFQQFEHVEENFWYQNVNNDEVANQIPNWNKNKTWYWNWFGNLIQPHYFKFSCNNLVLKKMLIYFKL